MNTLVTYRCPTCQSDHSFVVPESGDKIHGLSYCEDCGREFSSADHEWILQQAWSIKHTGEKLKL